jgi:aryl-alcohol dehydrogenase-like predicted oxidoreductase
MQFPASDVRSWIRFSPEARAANQPIVGTVRGVAAAHNAIPAQIAPAWLLAQRPSIVPIPGTAGWSDYRRTSERIPSS